MVSDVCSTAAECLAEFARDDRERLIEDIEWLARQIEAGPDDIGGRSLYSNGCLDVSKLARRVRRLAFCVTAPHLVSPDEALAPSGVAPLGEAGDMGFIVHGHVDRAEALRRARKVPCLADLLNGPGHDEQELEHGHFMQCSSRRHPTRTRHGSCALSTHATLRPSRSLRSCGDGITAMRAQRPLAPLRRRAPSAPTVSFDPNAA